MRAMGLTAFGGPEVLRVLDLPAPEAGPGGIRIRVDAATVNPVDALVRRGFAFVSDAEPPYVPGPGMDAAAVVEQIGAGVDSDLAVGDRVMAVVVVSGTQGACAEHVVVPAESAVRGRRRLLGSGAERRGGGSEQVDEAVALGARPGAEAGGQGGVDGLLELTGEGFALGGEVDAGDPAVVGVGLAGDQVASLEPVDQSGDVGLVAVQQGRQLAEGGLEMLGETQQLRLLGGQS